MLIVAQVGFPGGAAVVLGLVIIVLAPVAFTAAWFGFPSILRVAWDLIRRRDLMAESDADRSLDGRLFTKHNEPARRETQDQQ